MRRFVVLASAVLTTCALACATSAAPPPVATPPAPAPVDVAPVPEPSPVDTAALKDKAEDAVATAAKKLHEIARTCGQDWLETNVACPESEFTQLATDYQAYYAERPDPGHETGSYYSLRRLGGPTRTVEQVTSDLVMGCEDGCRSARNESIGSALDEAVEACKKAKGGFASCKALEKKLAKSVRPSEVERWEETCESRCDDHRARVRYAAERERKRPKTPAEAARCQAACRAKHEGSWCGTGLLECLSDCTMKGAATPLP